MRLAARFVRLALQVDADRLADEVAALPPEVWRAHPEAAPGNTAAALVSVGGRPDSDEVTGVMQPTPVLEHLPYTRQVLAALQAPIGRTRLMRIAAEGRLDTHVDTNRYWQDHLRVHVPVLTDRSVRFRCEDETVHMAPGEVWVFDTWRRHGVDNPASAARVHLVIDTVGSSALWQTIAAGHRHGTDTHPTGPIVPGDAVGTTLPAFEAVNALAVTSPWEQSAHARMLLEELGPDAPDELVAMLDAFVQDWRAMWAVHGPAPSETTDYRRLLDRLEGSLAAMPAAHLPNGTAVDEAVRQLLIRPALLRSAGTSSAPAAPAAPPASRRRSPVSRPLDRPIFVLSPPRSGSTLLFETLSRTRGLHTIGGESHEVFESIPDLRPDHRGWASNALSAEDATDAVVRRLEDDFVARAVDRDGRRPSGQDPLRLLEKTPKNVLRVPFLAAAFPDAQFVVLHRDHRATLSSMLDAWRSGRFVTYPDLPGWPGPPWSLLLTPGWQELAGRPLVEVVARQWMTATTALLDAVAELDPDCWWVADHEALLADPNAEVERLCAWLDLEWDTPIEGPLPLSRHVLDPPAEEKWRRNADELAAVAALVDPVARRFDEVMAAATSKRPEPARRPAATTHPPAAAPSERPATSPDATLGPSDFASRHTPSVAELLRLGGFSVIISTYQTGRVVVLRSAPDGSLNTHLRAFPRAMGVAVQPGRLAIGTANQVWELRDQPAAAARLGPPAHDACFVPRRAHVTGDVSVHELAWVDDDLWMVNTRFSCLATLDADHSFVPRWRPRFVTALQPEDRCHLNGLALVDGRPAFVTALGVTDEPGGWRSGKVGGGVVVDIDSGDIVAHGLAMPHSPRWHDGRLWVLDSGRGHLSTIDIGTGRVEPVVRLPGFTRGLAFAGRYALVGLSKVRDHVFAGLPLAEHVEERACGIWVVDTVSGQIVGFLQFVGLVEEVFDVQVVPGVRFPELLEPTDSGASNYVVLPDAFVEGPAATTSR